MTSRIPEAWPLLLDREQLCAYLSMSADTIAKVCPVPPVDVGARVTLWNREKIDAWALGLPAKLPKAAENAHTPPAPVDLADDRRSAALERIKARSRHGRVPGSTRPARKEA